MTVRPLPAAALAAVAATACATTAPAPIACRDATEAERAAFGAIIAHDEARLAQLMAATPEARRVAELDPELETQVFGHRMGDRSVRTVMMQPPLCLWDEEVSETERVTYVFPAGRFERLQDEAVPGAELGAPAIDHAACRFVNQDGQWTLADACLQTFASVTPAS